MGTPQTGIGDYDRMLQAVADTRTLSQKAEDIYQNKEKALEITKTLGEVKTYLSGKPIINNLVRNISRTTPEVAEKLGLDQAGALDRIQGALSSASREVQSVIQRGRNLLTSSQNVAPEEIELQPVAGFKGENPLEDAGHETKIADIGSKEAESQLEDKVAQSSFGQTVKSTVGKRVSEGASKASRAAEEEDVADGLMEVGPADLIGLVAGAGLSLYAALHHPKAPKPSDGIRVSTQIGVE